jgi:hypothetical protein
MQASRLLGIALLATTAAAQGTIVSPVGASTVEGSSANLFPWTTNTPRRYMQLHSDLGATPLAITMLSFRVSAGTTLNAGTRIHDVELYLGEGRNALQPSYVFDNNYVAPKQLMIPRTLITFGPQGQAVTPGPNPFTGNMDLILPAPFIYTGANSLVWEATCFGMTAGAAGTFGTPDAEQGVLTTATSTVTGPGCVATGQAAAMTHTLSCTDVAGTLVLNSTLAAGPANSLCFLAVGFQNPNLAFPGLCSPVYTDAILTQVMGITDAAGAITTNTPAGATFTVPNLLTGLTITTQAFAIDLGRIDPIPFCGSDGRSVVVPGSNLARVNLATRIFNNAGGTTATQGIFFTSTVGYALVTQFSHL